MTHRHSRVQVLRRSAAAAAAALTLVLVVRGKPVAADTPPYFVPGNLVVSRSVYQGSAGTVTVGQLLPGTSPVSFSGTGAVAGGSGPVSKGSLAMFVAGGLAQITHGASVFPVTITGTDSVALTVSWTPAVGFAVKKTDTITPFATANGSYPGVWANEAQDASFGITSPIYLDQMTTDGTVVTSLPISGMVTSFPSKSELGLNLSPDGSRLTFMGYKADINLLDVSNSNVPNHVDPTNPVALTYARAVGDVDSNGNVSITPVNAYSGNNGRAAIFANGLYYLVGNAGNGSGTEPVNIVSNTGVQAATPGGPAEPTVIGAQQGTPGSSCGFQFGFSVALLGINPCPAPPATSDKSGKDDNFRGLTIFNNTLYVTKGSGSNGVDTVYQVGAAGTLPTLANASTTSINVLPGFPTAIARTANNTNTYPFALWFANATTLYVADEGDGKTPADAADNPNAGLQKWVFNGSTWQLAYVLQTGLNLGTKYPVVGYDDPSLDPAPAGLRNLTGRVNDDGSVNIWAVTSTVSALTDQGADPNQLVTITDALGNTDPGVASTESFSVVRTAQSGEVLRGVSFAPGTINPTWTVTAAPPADGYGWNKTSVQVTLTPTVPKGDTPSVSYSLSGAQVGGPTLVASPAGFPVTAEGTTVVSFFAQNGAGSRSTTRTLTLNIDETAPTISGGLTPAPNANGWINSLPVTLAFTCADSLSGLVAPAPPPEILTAEVTGGSSPLTTCTDKAENSSSLTVSPINIDVTAPVVTAAASPSIIWPPNGKMVPVTISGTLRDARSGIDPSTARFTVVDQYGRVQPSGSFAVNADGTYSFKIALEASRDGADKNGRTYLVTISVSDLAGNSQSRTVAVLVPHDAASIK